MPAFSHFNGALRYAAEGILNALQQQPAEQPEKVAWRPQEGDKVRVIPRNPAYQPHLATYHGPQGEDMYGEDVHHVRGVNNGVRLSIAVQGSRIEHPEHRGVTIGDLMPAAQQPAEQPSFSRGDRVTVPINSSGMRVAGEYMHPMASLPGHHFVRRLDGAPLPFVRTEDIQPHPQQPAPAAQPQSESHEDAGEQWQAGWQPVPGERVRYYDSRTGQDRHVIYNGMTPHGHANVDILAPRQSHHDPSDVQSNNVVPVRALERIHSSAGLVDSNRNRIEVGSQFHIEGTERPWTLTAVDQGAAIAWLSQPTSDAEGAPRRHNYVHVQRSISGDYHYMPGRQATRLDEAQSAPQQPATQQQQQWRPQVGERVRFTHLGGQQAHAIVQSYSPSGATVRVLDGNGRGDHAGYEMGAPTVVPVQALSQLHDDSATLFDRNGQPIRHLGQVTIGDHAEPWSVSAINPADGAAWLSYVSPTTGRQLQREIAIRRSARGDNAWTAYLEPLTSFSSQQPAAAPAQREAWPPTRGRGVRVLSLMGDSFIPGSHTYSHAHQPDGRYHFVHMRDASGRDLGVSDVHESRIFHPSRDISLAGGSRGAQQPAQPQPAQQSDQSESRLNQLLRNAYPTRYIQVAEKLRQRFAQMFPGRQISDGTILRALRVPMTFLGSNESEPHFRADKLHLHVNLDDPGYIGASVSSRVPNYSFSANTTVYPTHVYNSYQKHEGEENTDRKVFSTPHILLNQANAAHELGLPYLKLNAAMDRRWTKGDFTGGIVWPRYGYNSRLSSSGEPGAAYVPAEALERIKQHLAAHGHTGVIDLHSLMRTPGGYELLSHHTPNGYGKTYHNAPNGEMKFDVKPGSYSRELLAERIASVERGGKHGRK